MKAEKSTKNSTKTTKIQRTLFTGHSLSDKFLQITTNLQHFSLSIFSFISLICLLSYFLFIDKRTSQKLIIMTILHIRNSDKWRLVYLFVIDVTVIYRLPNACAMYYFFESVSKLENYQTYCLKLSTKAPQKRFSQYIENITWHNDTKTQFFNNCSKKNYWKTDLPDWFYSMPTLAGLFNAKVIFFYKQLYIYGFK